jgi:hypothetical protein
VAEADRILTDLMGKNVEALFNFIMERAAQADVDLRRYLRPRPPPPKCAPPLRGAGAE